VVAVAAWRLSRGGGCLISLLRCFAVVARDY
jgi:hypothetical protein